MSQYPYQDPGSYGQVPYATPGVANAARRPGAVTGLAITGIVLGILAVVITLINLGSAAVMLGNGGHNLLMPGLPPMDKHVIEVGLVQGTLSVVLSIVMVCACIAGLKLRPLARKTIIGWSYIVIVFAIARVIVQIEWVGPITRGWMAQAQPNNPAVGLMGSLMVPMAIFSGLMQCVLPILFLILWNRPHVKAAFGVK